MVWSWVPYKVSHRGVTLGAGDGSVLLIGTDDDTFDGILITNGVVIDITEYVTEVSTLRDDD